MRKLKYGTHFSPQVINGLLLCVMCILNSTYLTVWIFKKGIIRLIVDFDNESDSTPAYPTLQAAKPQPIIADIALPSLSANQIADKQLIGQPPPDRRGETRFIARDKTRQSTRARAAARTQQSEFAFFPMQNNGVTRYLVIVQLTFPSNRPNSEAAA